MTFFFCSLFIFNLSHILSKLHWISKGQGRRVNCMWERMLYPFLCCIVEMCGSSPSLYLNTPTHTSKIKKSDKWCDNWQQYCPPGVGLKNNPQRVLMQQRRSLASSQLQANERFPIVGGWLIQICCSSEFQCSTSDECASRHNTSWSCREVWFFSDMPKKKQINV